MPHPDQLRDIEDSRAGGKRGPAPRASRSYHAWLWLVVGLIALGFGIGFRHGLLIAAGLVAAGAAGQLFDPERRGRNRRSSPGTRSAS